MTACADQNQTFVKLKRTFTKAILERQSRNAFDHETGELEWIIFERAQVHMMVNTLRSRNGGETVSIERIGQVERSAIGHVNYLEKLALRCTDLAYED